MNEWNFVFITIQYLAAGSIAIILGCYVLYKNRQFSSAKFFLGFSVCVFLWQLFIFLHRNAPNAALSKLFFELGSGFASLVYPMLFLVVSFLGNGNRRHILMVIPNIIFFIYILVYEPINVFWTTFGWSYEFTQTSSSYILFSLTIFYVILNYIWIIKPIRESKVPIIRRKYKFILYGFTIMFFVGVVIFNTLLLPIFPNAPPFGGFTAVAGLSMIAYGILLKEKPKEVSFWMARGQLSERLALFLQKFFNSMYEGGLGQAHLRFEKYLKETGLDESVSFTEGKIVLLKEPSIHQIVNILNNTLSYLERGEVKEEALSDLIEFWNTIYPLIEVDTVDLIKAHENYIRRKKLIYEIAEGRFRSIFLPEGFLEKDLDAFSQLLGFTHKNLFGNPVLAVFNPSKRYEAGLKAYIIETLANNEELAVFSRKSSTILGLLPNEEVRIFYLSPENVKRSAISEREVYLPLYDLTRLLAEIRLVAEKSCSLLFDNLTDLIHSIGFEKAYRFTRHAVEFAVSYNVPALFLIAEGHRDEVKVAFENLFPVIVKLREESVIRLR
jgi:hypothetical protein